ncbi:MAG: hypothetical protein IKZ67_07810, partial [Paludibacteraceae bacterium]|nr:hypothetical protein [Paludibacteraceae bacterium]
MSLKDLFIRPENNPNKQGNNRNVNNPNTRDPRKEESNNNHPQPEPEPEPSAPTEQINMDNIIHSHPEPEQEGENSSITEVNNVKKKRLWETLIKRNLPGPDMLELKSYSASLESMGLTQ